MNYVMIRVVDGDTIVHYYTTGSQQLRNDPLRFCNGEPIVFSENSLKIEMHCKCQMKLILTRMHPFMHKNEIGIYLTELIYHYLLLRSTPY